MRVLYIMPFKISADKWHLTGDTNMGFRILESISKFNDLSIDVVGNFKNNLGNDVTSDVMHLHNVKNCIDLSSVIDSRNYLVKGFEYLKSLDIFRNYDIINIHNSNPSIISKISQYLKDYKVIFTLHAPPENMTFQYYHKDQYLTFLTDPRKLLLCVSMSHADRCLKALDYFKVHPDIVPSIDYVLNGIDTKFYAKFDRTYDCGTIGRFSASKNVLESLKCVEAITRSTGGKGFLVGTTSNYEGGTDAEKKYAESIMEVLDQNPQISWYESLPSEKVQYLLSVSKCYVSLSTIETFGLTVCEALMQGTPCIGFDINGIGEIIEDGITGYKFKKSRSRWVDKYKQSIDLYNKCLNLDHVTIRERAIERFSIDRVGQEYYNVYSKMMRV